MLACFEFFVFPSILAQALGSCWLVLFLLIWNRRGDTGEHTGCSVQQKRLVVLELFLCLFCYLRYFFIDVKRCICSIYIIGAFISYLLIELSSSQFSSRWICSSCCKQRHFDSWLAQSLVIASEQLLSGRCGERLLAGFCWFVSCYFFQIATL